MIDRKRVILYIMSCVQQEHKTIRNARVAQLVERDLAKVEAAGSSPVSRSFYFIAETFSRGFPLFSLLATVTLFLFQGSILP